MSPFFFHVASFQEGWSTKAVSSVVARKPQPYCNTHTHKLALISCVHSRLEIELLHLHFALKCLAHKQDLLLVLVSNKDNRFNLAKISICPPGLFHNKTADLREEHSEHLNILISELCKLNLSQPHRFNTF